MQKQFLLKEIKYEDRKEQKHITHKLLEKWTKKSHFTE